MRRLTMLCRPAGLPLLVRGYLAFLMLLGSTGSIAYGQATNISATPSGPGGLGTTLSTSGNTTNITGGTRPGGGPNLFHSFNQFSVGAGDVASFVNPGGVSNVISRVIGGSPSNINGTVQALNANLFFLNPSGIIFGPSAHLNVSGSAYFSTAQQLRLSDGGIFTASTTLLGLDSTLSASSPAAFGFLGQGPYGTIVLSSSSTVLQTGAVLGLMGGGIQINGSKITAQRVMLGSTSSGGEMSTQAFVGNPFSGAAGNGQVQALPGTLIVAGGGGVIPASIDVSPNVTVPTGAQVNSTTNSFTQRVTQIQVVGVNLGGLPPLATANAANVNPANPVEPVAFLNRAAMVLPQEAPAPPAPLLTSRCAARKDGAFSSLVQASRDVTPSQPGRSLAAPVVLEEIGGDVDPVAPPASAAHIQGQTTAQLMESWQGC
ncbi:MAG: filamentous hemagglutinin N-terminal domain-containing protein [Nitrospira sp. NTP1]|nr:filamentous hemagglutinin N-terminal domain-containing protein [Nitrospira sp. NTP1]